MLNIDAFWCGNHECPELQLGGRDPPGRKSSMIQYELALQTRTLPGKEVFVVLNHRAFVQRGLACSHTSSGRARALSSQGKKKKPSFSRASKQNKQNIRIRRAQCFPLSAWAPRKRQHAPTFSRTPTFSGEGAKSLGTKDKMRAWWAHNNQKRKGANLMIKWTLQLQTCHCVKMKCISFFLEMTLRWKCRTLKIRYTIVLCLGGNCQPTDSRIWRDSRLAVKYLAIPATAAPSERIWSQAARVLTVKQNRMSEEITTAMIRGCTHKKLS